MTIMDSVTLQEIAGDHLSTYEKFYRQCNPNDCVFIKALDAATFLRKSGLNQMVLKNIWDLSDPNSLGHLDKKAFFVALKLISMVQNGKEASYNDLKSPLPPPKINDDFFKSIDWNISMESAQKFTMVFNSMNPLDGKLAGTKVKPYLMSSKLPIENLTRIWDLSDIDQDGFLNLKEFIICCQLIAKATQGFILPAVLPPELSNFNPLAVGNENASVRSLSRGSSVSGSASPHLNQWVISIEDKTKSDELFVKLDKDKDGFVTGIDVKDTLLESGLPQQVLAHIWNLCDMKETGKLNSEQFALAQYFIKQKQSGLELPLKLLPNMIPPTLRPKPMESVSNENINGSLNQSTSSVPSTGNKELDVLNEEIKKLHVEKTKYESEVMQEEASLRLKQSEIKSIQNEIEALAQMLKQLENQRNDAKKRVDDMSAQVETLNRQFIEQKKGIDDQVGDLESKKKEFESLKQEETVLEGKLSTSKNEMEQISKLATETQLEISQIKANTMELEEYERRYNEMIYDYDNAISNNDYAKITSLLPRSVTPPPVLDQQEEQENTFDESAFRAEFNSDPFAGEDPFKDDPFGTNKANEAFGSSDVNFANFDAFGSSTSNKNDPFGFSPFDSNHQASNDRSESPTPALPPKKSKAPPPRPAPPKASTTTSSTSKTPLRAAPPPPAAGNKSNTGAFNSTTNFDPFNDQNSDPFGSSTNSNSFSTTQNFANFADFD